MKILIKLLFLFFVLSLKPQLFAQEYTVTNYSILNNIRGTYVYSAFQDNQGFLWFATHDGAFKFDGKYFTKFSSVHDLQNVNFITQDSKGNYWFSSIKGIYKFNGKACIPVFVPNKRMRYTKKIIEDHNGALWFAGDHSLYLLKDSHLEDFSDKIDIGKSILRDVVSRPDGELLFVTTSGVKKFDGKNFSSLNEFNSLDLENLSAICIDNMGVKWCGFKNGNVIKYDGNIKKLSFKTSDNKRIFDITEDKDRNLWLCSADGLLKYDGSKFSAIKTYKDTLAKLVSNIFQDNEGNLWACTRTGVCRIQKNKFSKINSFFNINFKHVASITEDLKGRIWFGSSYDGLLVYDQGKFKKFRLGNNPRFSQISSVLCKKDGSIWFATSNGLVRYKDEKLRTFNQKDGLKDRNIGESLIEDKDGNLWFRNGYDICKFDGKQFSFPSKFTKKIYRLFNIKQNEVWMGTTDKIITSDGKEMLSFKNNSGFSISQQTNVKLKRDKDNVLWIAALNKGFGRISPNGKMQEVISAADGLLENAILCMTFDKNGNLWLGTTNGVSKFYAEEYKRTGNKNFENYINSDDEITAKALSIFEDSKGNIWVGTTHGILKFNKNNSEEDPHLIPPSMHITEIKLYLDKFNYLSYSDSLNIQTGLPVHLKLPYEKNYLSFDFIGLNYTSPENVEYKYKLNGFDSTWSPVVKLNEVTYTNLPPGKYKFEVMARNKDGIWSTSSASFYFIISPPFWKTWWFYLVCLVAGISFVLGSIRVRTSNLEKQKLELEKTVDLRTKELQEEKSKVEEVNRELEKSRYQLSKINELQAKWLNDLSESEKQLMESNTNKDKLFSIISHDLKSPFRSLLMYSESMLNKLDSLTVKEIKEYTLDVHKYAENIYRLLEDLLEWSRIQIGRMEFEPKKFNISNSVSRTLDMLKGNAEKKNITVRNKVMNPTYGFADENMFNSVLNNLVSNAVKFTENSGTIEITAVKENGYVRVSICDNGIGMSEDELLKLFKIEKHFHKSGTANEKGTGLGLILSKELIEKNGGTISIYSKSGEGSQFIFTIPSEIN